ncbi:xylose isomerase-like protein [Aspergillus karnatakaensis]|uniref:DNA-(apurinic or apyrimidinic site) lyase APN1 n=1 Tax=Aspergillus karnatakaensis TaxID=1810916 RepID=UPI003CCDBACB
MPPRALKKATIPTPSDEPQIENKKRDLEENALLSPRRQSKRIKSTEQLRTVSSDREQPEEVRVKRAVRSSRKTIKVEDQAQDNTIVEAIEEEVKQEESVEVKTEEADEKAAVATKSTRKRKTKKEQEAEMLPLRARTQGLRMYVGAHVSAAKGVFNAVNNSTHIGGNAFALFLKSQRKWDNPPLQDEHRDNFRKLCKENDYDASKYVLPHGSYLVNLAQDDKAKAKQAYDAFLDDLLRCEALGIKLYNFHPGSAGKTTLPSALSRLAKALTNALNATSTVVPVLETMAGQGTVIGGRLSDFRPLFALIPKELHPRLGICIDTCHSFSAGYDLASPAGFQSFMGEFEDLIGIQHLRALHLNDSKAPRGSNRDLHANIGTGFLGLRAFHNVMNEPRFEGIPMILETPIDRAPPGATPDEVKENEEASDLSASDEDKPKPKKKQTKKPASAKSQLVPDHSVWAREIELLESLIGMDPAGQTFLDLEARLAEEGRETREKHMEQFKRKLEADEKKKAKGAGKQKTLMEMMGGNKRTSKASKKREETESEDEGCQSC